MVECQLFIDGDTVQLMVTLSNWWWHCPTDGDTVQLMVSLSNWWCHCPTDGDTVQLMVTLSNWWWHCPTDGDTVQLMVTLSNWWCHCPTDGDTVQLMVTLSNWWWHCPTDGVTVQLMVSLSNWWCHCPTDGVTVQLMVTLSNWWCHCPTDGVTLQLMVSLSNWWWHYPVLVVNVSQAVGWYYGVPGMFWYFCNGRDKLLQACYYCAPLGTEDAWVCTHYFRRVCVLFKEIFRLLCVYQWWLGWFTCGIVAEISYFFPVGIFHATRRAIVCFSFIVWRMNSVFFLSLMYSWYFLCISLLSFFTLNRS